MMPRPTLRLVHPRATHLLQRTLTTTTARHSAFFNLNGLSGSREAQYLSREHNLPRSDYSANAHLIRASEVDPLGPETPGAARWAAAANNTKKKNARYEDKFSRDKNGDKTTKTPHGAFGANMETVEDAIIVKVQTLERRVETLQTRLNRRSIALLVLFFIFYVEMRMKAEAEEMARKQEEQIAGIKQPVTVEPADVALTTVQPAPVEPEQLIQEEARGGRKSWFWA